MDNLPIPARVGNQDLECLAAYLRGRSFLALTGAGCSTDSGIPDYRSPERQARRRPPLQYAEFCSSESARQRYWARAFCGWPRFVRAKPNPTHQVLAELEARGACSGVLTQNVDGLHQRAGSRQVMELHGNLQEVRCLKCGQLESRQDLQVRLQEKNPSFGAPMAETLADGDVELAEELVLEFRLCDCLRCGGLLKPNVVFFGEAVQKTRAQQAELWVQKAEALLVLGSSLTVLSGFRHARAISRLGRPLLIINRGPTRADELADLKLDADLSESLLSLQQLL